VRRPAFRFRPPPLAATPELPWVLARAFAPPGAGAPPPDPEAALELAWRLGLLPRIAMRLAPESLAAELGERGAELLRRERALATARELSAAATLAEVAAAARAVGAPIAPLKGRALTLAGEAAPESAVKATTRSPRATALACSRWTPRTASARASGAPSARSRAASGLPPPATTRSIAPPSAATRKRSPSSYSTSRAPSVAMRATTRRGRPRSIPSPS